MRLCNVQDKLVQAGAVLVLAAVIVVAMIKETFRRQHVAER